jgi:hypothetical protein
MGKVVHHELFKYPVLRFFANIIDPEGEHETETIITAICEKFTEPVPSSDTYFSLNNRLAVHIKSERKKELFVEVPVYGFIRVWKEYSTMYYKEYSYNFSEMAIIEVNSKEIDIRNGWDEEKMLTFKDAILTMYDAAHKENCWPDIFEQSWVMFEKGSKDGARDAFRNACERLSQENDDGTCLGERMTKYALFVKGKWDNYLWEEDENNVDSKFALGLQSFIARNLEAWLQGNDMHHAQIRVYTPMHEEAVKMFSSFEEAMVLYMPSESVILALWDRIHTQEERNYSQGQ